MPLPNSTGKSNSSLKNGKFAGIITFDSLGCTRIYRVGPTGMAHIIKFLSEDWWISDRKSVLTEQPALNNIDAAEDTWVLQWIRENYDHLVAGWTKREYCVVFSSRDERI